MLDLLDLLGFVLSGAIALLVGIGFRALPPEKQRRWKRPLILIFSAVAVLAFVQWIWLFSTYRP
jgi:membrane protein DedA with SNARE-associated domain